MFRDYIKKSDTCQRMKVKQAAPAELIGHRVIEAPWMVVAADVMGPLPQSKAGFAYILVIYNLFIK